MEITNTITNWKDKWNDFWSVPQNQILFAYLPLYFNWYPILYRSYSDLDIRKHCLRSMLNTILFFSIVFVSILFSKLPIIGSTLGNVFHGLGIIFYLGLSAFFIYNQRTGKNMEIAVFENVLAKLEQHLS
jgi:uncharacterized membrane protein